MKESIDQKTWFCFKRLITKSTRTKRRKRKKRRRKKKRKRRKKRIRTRRKTRKRRRRMEVKNRETRKTGKRSTRTKKRNTKKKKEKRGDKKKDKEDQSKDKDKSSISEESTVARKLEERSGEKLHPEGHNKYSSFEDEGKCSSLFHGKNGKRPLQSILPSQAIKEARFVQEVDERIRDEEKGGGSQFLQRVADVGKRDQEAATGIALWNPSQVLAEDKNCDGDRSVHVKKLDLQGRNGEYTGKATVQSLTLLAKSENEGIHRLLKVQNDVRLEDKEKYNETRADKKGDKQKDRDKKSHRKDKHKDKKKKKEEKVLANIKTEKVELKNSGRNDLAGTTYNTSVNLVKDVVGAAIIEGTVKKRKDMDTNGFLHDAVGTAIIEGSVKKRKDMDTNGFLYESEIRPNKVQRLALHNSTENGTKLEASSKSSSDKHDVPNNDWLDHGDRLNNGTKEAKKPSPSKLNHPSGIKKLSDQVSVLPKTPHPDFSKVNEVSKMPKMKDHAAEASRRPPHPDSKYLSQILAVPTVGEWSEDDGQEWLFSKKGPPHKSELESIGLKEELQVWSEAVHIESADVCALPYVIPY